MKTQDIKNMGLAHRQVQEAGTATHKPNNGSDPEQGLSPNAKKEKARTSGVGVDANKSIDLSFKAFKAMSKTAKHNGGINPPGDKAVVKSTMAPAANQKTESVDENLSDMSKYKKAGKAKEPGVKIGKSIKGTIMKPVKAAYHGEAMDPVGQGDADIDNDGDVDKSDKYLHNRRKAISKARKGKGRVDEISTDMQKRYMKKAVPQYKKANDKKELGAFGSATQKGADANQKKYDKRHKGIGSVIKRKASGGISTKTDRAIASDPKRNSMTGKPAPYKEGAMKRMSTGDGMDTYKKKPAGEKAVMHGGKSGEKKNKEIMAVGEER